MLAYFSIALPIPSYVDVILGIYINLLASLSLFIMNYVLILYFPEIKLIVHLIPPIYYQY